MAVDGAIIIIVVAATGTLLHGLLLLLLILVVLFGAAGHSRIILHLRLDEIRYTHPGSRFCASIF
jgi:hypothetical protein